MWEKESELIVSHLTQHNTLLVFPCWCLLGECWAIGSSPIEHKEYLNSGLSHVYASFLVMHFWIEGEEETNSTILLRVWWKKALIDNCDCGKDNAQRWWAPRDFRQIEIFHFLLVFAEILAEVEAYEAFFRWPVKDVSQ